MAAMLSSCDSVVGPDADLATGEENAAIAALPPGQSAIKVQPAGPITLEPGDTVSLRATMPAGGGGLLIYESADTTVATVSPAGLLTAHRTGSTQVIVSLKNDSSSRTAVLVSVRSRGSSKVELRSILGLDGLPVEKDDARGKILVDVAFTRGDAIAVEVLVDSIIACSSPLSRTAPLQILPETETASCELDTAAYDSITGAPSLLNGPIALTARLVGGQRKVLASTGTEVLQLANKDTLVTSLVAETRSADQSGRPWIGGDLSVTALPVLYTGSARPASVSFRYRSPDGRTFAAVDTAAPYRITFKRVDLTGVLDERFRVFASSTLASGVAGPVSTTSEAAFDGIAPPVGSLERREWIGAKTSFGSLYTRPAERDQGVGRSAPIFFVGSSSNQAASIFTSGARIAVGGELKESAAGAYRLVYRVCDAVQNCTDQEGFDFGVDLKPPTFSSISLAPRSVNPEANFHVAAVDQRSGLGHLPLSVAVTYFAAGASRAMCGPVVDGIRFPGTGDASSCEQQRVSGDLPVPNAAEGYFIYRISAVDLAGNRADARDRVVLIDKAAPELLQFSSPAQFTPGEEATVSAQVADNVDLGSVDFRILYGTAGLALPFGAATEIGKPFTGAATRSSVVTAKMPFVRTLTSLDPESRSTVLAAGVQAKVLDAAGFAAVRTRDLASGDFSGNTYISDPFSAVSSAVLSTGAGTLCTEACQPSEATSLPVTIKIVGDAGLSGFSKMFLFGRGEDGVVTQLASTSLFSVLETGTQRTYTYTFNYAPSSGSKGKLTLFGVGVSSAGNGLRTTESAVDFFAR